MTPVIDLSTVPDAELYAEIGRRRGRLRKSYTGGTVWAEHNPDTKRCRCVDCNAKRHPVEVSKVDIVRVNALRRFGVTV